MPLREARQLARRCSEGFAAEDDKKLTAAFEDTIIRMLAHRDSAQRSRAAADLGTYRKADAVDALLLATGNDWRAVEAGAHAYAARNGRYEPLSRWWKGDDGKLKIENGIVALGSNEEKYVAEHQELLDIDLELTAIMVIKGSRRLADEVNNERSTNNLSELFIVEIPFPKVQIV